MGRSIAIETNAEWPVATKLGLALLILAALIGITVKLALHLSAEAEAWRVATTDNPCH